MAGEVNRAERRAAQRKAAKAPEPVVEAEAIGLETVFDLKMNGEQLAFLRLLLGQASIAPARLKIVCGQTQEQIEALIGPLQPPGQ